MTIVRCPEASLLVRFGVQKRKTAVFRLKLRFYLKKVCYKVFCVNTVSDKVVRAFTGLFIDAKMVRGGRPLLRKNLAETDQPL